MKITVELFGAAREFSNKDFIELNLLQPSSIKDLKNELVKMIDDNNGLISEFLFEERPIKSSFPRRNRFSCARKQENAVIVYK